MLRSFGPVNIELTDLLTQAPTFTQTKERGGVSFITCLPLALQVIGNRLSVGKINPNVATVSTNWLSVLRMS